jgi:basic amino acid/polyamine antiporter, APA family
MPRSGRRTANIPVAAAAAVPAGPEDRGLRRAITPRMLLFFIVGDILGGGIYALVGEVGGETGGAIWAGFALALVMAAFTAGSYAELVSKYPRAGGAGLYVHRAFGRPLLTFLVAFAVVVSGITSASALARGFGGDYLSEFVSVPVVVTALALLALIAAINLRGIEESVKLNVGFTLVEIGGLLLIVLIAAVALAQGDAEPGRALEFKEGSSVLGVTLASAALAFYALIGFEDSVNVAEETREPNRTYPKALFGGLAIAGALYMLVTVGASMVVPTSDLTESSGPLLEVVRGGPLDVPEKLFAAIGLLALSNGALINMIMASRLLYGMAEERVVPRPFARVLPGRRTPMTGTAANAVVRDRVHFGDRRGARRHRRPRLARRHDGRAARRRLRGRERLRARAAPRRRRPRALQGVVVRPRHRRAGVDRAADAGRSRDLPAGRDPRRGRRRAVGDELARPAPRGRR